MNNNNMPSIHITTEIQESFKPEVLDVIRNSFAPTATDAEFILFAHKAASYGLDPFKNEIFFIKYGSTARIQFAAEAYLSKAREKEGFQPPNTQMVHANDEFKIGINPETKHLEVLQHEIGFPRGAITGAYCIANRDGHIPVTVIMDIEEVEHMFKGQNKDNWLKWTSDMFGKHVQQRALKKQYGLEFEDVTIKQDEQPKPPRDITPKETVLEHAEPEQPKEDPAMPLRRKINALFKQLGITTKEQVKEFLELNAPQFNQEKATPVELGSLIDLLQVNLDMQNESDDEML